MSTPWGHADFIEKIAEGLYLVGTASGGGYKLLAKTNAAIPRALRSGAGWYKEDAKASIVVLAFPDVFGDERVSIALRSVKDRFPDEYTKSYSIAVAVAESRVLRDRQFAESTRERFVVKSILGDWHEAVPDGYVGAWAVRPSDGTKRAFLVPTTEYEARGATQFVVDTTAHRIWECAPA